VYSVYSVVNIFPASVYSVYSVVNIFPASVYSVYSVVNIFPAFRGLKTRGLSPSFMPLSDPSDCS